MLAILSPAKIQNFLSEKIEHNSVPNFLKEAALLSEIMKQFSISELAMLLKVNLNMAENVADSYFNRNASDSGKQALYVYNGEAFKGVDVRTLSQKEVDYLQEHLLIFSALYGALRPLDLIQPYRLDMLTRIDTGNGQSLYQFWKVKLTQFLKNRLNERTSPPVLLNLASAEFFKLIDTKKLNAKIINFEFLQYQPDTDQLKQITVHTKKARGLMVRYLAMNQLSNPEELKGFNFDGYWYNEELSTDDKFVFIR